MCRTVAGDLAGAEAWQHALRRAHALGWKLTEIDFAPFAEVAALQCAEIWELGAEAFGRLVAGVPAPLSIGTITLADGRGVKGFLCQTSAVARAEDTTAYGGWRAYRDASQAQPAR